MSNEPNKYRDFAVGDLVTVFGFKEDIKGTYLGAFFIDEIGQTKLTLIYNHLLRCNARNCQCADNDSFLFLKICNAKTSQTEYFCAFHLGFARL